MKRIMILLIFILICTSGIAEQMQEDMNTASYNEFLKYFKIDLESFSHRFADFDRASEELKKDIFSMNSNILERTGGRIYLLRTAQNAIDMANIIVENIQRRKIVPFIDKQAYSFKNLWIVVFQVGKSEEDIMRLDANTDLFIVLSKHTAEVLMIW